MTAPEPWREVPEPTRVFRRPADPNQLVRDKTDDQSSEFGYGPGLVPQHLNGRPPSEGGAYRAEGTARWAYRRVSDSAPTAASARRSPRLSRRTDRAVDLRPGRVPSDPRPGWTWLDASSRKPATPSPKLRRSGLLPQEKILLRRAAPPRV